MMLQNGVAPESRRRGTHHDICKANSHVPGTDLVNGAVVHNGWAGADTRTSDRTTAGTLNDTKPKVIVNGYIKHGCKSNSIKPAPPRTLRKHGSRKRDTEVVCLMNPAPPLMPPKEEENWENEILDVKVTDWEKLSFGNTPYGPEDVLDFSLRDLTLRQRDTLDLPVTANYSPAKHHPRPVRLSCYSVPTAQDQFADADE